MLEALGFRLWHPTLEARDAGDGYDLFPDGLDEFREHLGRELTLPMLKDIGTPIDIHQIDPGRVLAARDWLRRRDTARSGDTS